jgi:deoxyribodipyrimidine photo-lyase
MRTDFAPTRTAALERLHAFVPKAGGAYSAMRNHDVAGHPHVSTLSPYIRHRVVTEAEVAAAVLSRFAPSTAEKFLQEVCWRTYWKAWMDRRPAVWTSYHQQLAQDRDALATQSGLRRAWQDACAGSTGIAPFDAWAQELVQTGYMHNHARMWFASIWIFTLRLPWTLGADFFLRHLLDGDAGVNTLSWRWVAGLQTAGKTYAARADNITKYTEGRFGSAADLARALVPAGDVVPLGATAHPAPRPVPQPATFDPDLRTGLLLTEDDLSPGYLFDAGVRPVTGAVLLATARRSPLTVSPVVADFTRALAGDAATRWSDRAGGFSCVTQNAADIAVWADTHDLQQIVTPYAMAGTAREALAEVETLTQIPLRTPLRRWDATALPHATAGFFRFRQHIPDLLATL